MCARECAHITPDTLLCSPYKVHVKRQPKIVVVVVGIVERAHPGPNGVWRSSSSFHTYIYISPSFSRDAAGRQAANSMCRLGCAHSAQCACAMRTIYIMNISLKPRRRRRLPMDYSRCSVPVELAAQKFPICVVAICGLCGLSERLSFGSHQCNVARLFMLVCNVCVWL